MATRRDRPPLPADVEPDQVWRAADGQHFRVIEVVNGVAALHRATAAGRVLNLNYRKHEAVEKMQAQWQRVGDR